MDYHEHNRSKEDIIRIPLDGLTFMQLEEKMATLQRTSKSQASLEDNGVNSFGEMRSIYLA